VRSLFPDPGNSAPANPRSVGSDSYEKNTPMTDGPLIVQSDKTLLLEIDHEQADACRKAIAPFAELERSPEHIHTYRLTPLGLWNARAAGHDAEQVVNVLLTFSRYAVPHALLVDVAETMDRYGRLRLDKHPVHGLVLSSVDKAVFEEVIRAKKVAGMIGERIDAESVVVHPSQRGNLKQALLKLGWPAEDFAGYVDGEAHAIALDESEWTLRPYQREAADSFWHGGSGVVVLPCGAGKTLVGAAAMAQAQATTLILVTNTVSARQWKSELVRRTSLTEDEIGEYSGAKKEVKPVTIATYQVLTMRRKGVYPHLELLDAKDWGLIVYDEVHLLPAPIFRMTADLQARRRIGLTATLVREDGREGDVFSLIGPKRYDAPWKDIESQGWIAPADCVEVRVTLPEGERLAYATAEPEERYRLAACTHAKVLIAEQLVKQHQGEPTLVIGQYLEQLDELAEHLGAPVIKGETSVKERERLYAGFRSGEIELLVVSKVANFSIDLPSAAVAIQVSGSFGSRQEEAQRLGRLLRPKEKAADGTQKPARFYTIVSRDTVDADFAQNRQRFLAEQGYAYRIVDAADL
jgi:DNA excision repair protein ERCC-3